MWNLNSYPLGKLKFKGSLPVLWSEVAACSGSRDGATEYCCATRPPFREWLELASRMHGCSGEALGKFERKGTLGVRASKEPANELATLSNA